MIDYGRQRSSIRPNETEILETKVFTASNITEISEEGSDGAPGFEGYEFDMVEYTKNEYIQMTQEQSASLEDELTEAQLALCEIYELLS